MTANIEVGRIYKISYLDHSTGEHHGEDYGMIRLWKLTDIGKVMFIKDSHIVLVNSWGHNDDEEMVTKYTCILKSAIIEVTELIKK